MKDKFYYTLFFVFIFFSLHGNEFVIRYQILSSGTIFHVETKSGEKIGKIIRDSNHLQLPLPEIENQNDGDGKIFYSFLDLEEQLIVRGETKKSDKQTTLIFSKADGKNMGSFSAEIPNLYPTEYRIFSSNHQLVSLGYMNWLGNYFALAHPENPKQFVATFSRPMFKLFNDNWHFQIHEQNRVDFSILAIIGAFQTACDLNFELGKPKN